MMRGFVNLGNTCYLNAALQCLLHTPPLTNYVLREIAEQDLYKKRVNACLLANEYISLTKAYWRQPDSRALDPCRLRDALCKLRKQFASQQPHDAHEALEALLAGLHDALARMPRMLNSPAQAGVDGEAWEADCRACGYSIVTEVFQGQAECVVRCAEAGHRSVTHEHFRGLSLDVQDDTAVEQAIHAQLRAQPVEYALPDGRQARALQTRRFLYLPLILVLHLKRCDGAAHGNRATVEYPAVLSLASAAAARNEYHLFAACFHRDGHYTVACQSTGEWRVMNDAFVERVDASDVVGDLERARDAYVLLYKKKLADVVV